MANLESNTELVITAECDHYWIESDPYWVSNPYWRCRWCHVVDVEPLIGILELGGKVKREELGGKVESNSIKELGGKGWEEIKSLACKSL